MSSVELIAHRGTPRERRENTLPAFARAIDHGADGIELDVHFTADGVPVVHHDATLGASAGAYAGVSLATLTAAAIRVASDDPALAPPPLRDVAALVAGRATLYVEVKAAASDANLRALLGAVAPTTGADRVSAAVHAFDHRTALRVSTLAPRVPTGILSESYLVDTPAALRAARARDLWQHWSQLDAALVDAVHAAGGRIIAWTVNDADHARTLARLGVDGLCTDDVPLVRAALAMPT
ncbi:MAG TPA: glycerophosphodiester phosphodiesterase [Gemmatirosa sp.]